MNNPKPTTMDNYDNVTLARTILAHCETLFIAIEDKAKTYDSELSIDCQIKELAGIGRQLAFEWSNSFDCTADDISKHLGGEKHGN